MLRYQTLRARRRRFSTSSVTPAYTAWRSLGIRPRASNTALSMRRRAMMAFQGRPAYLTRRPWRRWRVEGGVQAQHGNQGHRFTEGLTTVEQIRQGLAVVSHHGSTPVRAESYANAAKSANGAWATGIRR